MPCFETRITNIEETDALFFLPSYFLPFNRESNLILEGLCLITNIINLTIVTHSVNFTFYKMDLFICLMAFIVTFNYTKSIITIKQLKCFNIKKNIHAVNNVKWTYNSKVFHIIKNIFTQEVSKSLSNRHFTI